VSWKTFKLLYRKFIQNNVYHILSESTAFCGRYDINIFVCFSGHSVDFQHYISADDSVGVAAVSLKQLSSKEDQISTNSVQ